MPPSIPLVVYGVATNTSIGDLFLAGIVPAFIVAAFLIVPNIILSKKAGYLGNGQKFSMKELLKATWEGIWALLMPVIILGGIYGGIFTPTEAAVNRRLQRHQHRSLRLQGTDFQEPMEDACRTTPPSWRQDVTFARPPPWAPYFPSSNSSGTDGFLFGNSSNKITVLLIVNVFLVFVGMVDGHDLANIIFSPNLLLALRPYGIDPVHFGLIMTINLAIGFVTPPVAANLFVASGMTGIPLDKVVKKAFPFIVAMFLALMLITYIPDASIGLLKLMGR